MRGLLFWVYFEALLHCGCFDKNAALVIWIMTEGSRVAVDVGAGIHLNTVQLYNSAPITIPLRFVHSAGRRKEKALTLSSHSACHSTAR
jgi:hypothetical protein